MAANVAFMYCCRRQAAAINNVQNNPFQGLDLTDSLLGLFAPRPHFYLNAFEKIALLYGCGTSKDKG